MNSTLPVSYESESAALRILDGFARVLAVKDDDGQQQANDSGFQIADLGLAVLSNVNPKSTIELPAR